MQFRMIRQAFKAIIEKPAEGEGKVSSFQALMVSTASRVGTGNIVGVSKAICLGGFGSVFWMWVIAIIGSASAFIESTLAQIYKKRGENGSYGGPAYYIEAALHSRPLALVFSVFLILTYAFGFNMLASYNLQSTFSSYSFYFFHGSYDVPLKASDKESLWESEEVYQFLICAICPVSDDYEPGEPECGFLFPAFKDRSSDIHRIDVFAADGQSWQAEELREILFQSI